MESIKVKKLDRAIKARVQIPGSKSTTNRSLFLSFLGDGKSIVKHPLRSDDTKVMLEALYKLGAGIKEYDNEIEIWGMGGKISKGKKDLYLGNAGTAVRFLTAFAATQVGEITIDGNERMRERPLRDLIEGITLLGAKVESNNYCPPVNIIGNLNFPDEIKVRGDTSSQYVSGLLLIAPLLPNGLKIVIEGELVSKPYIDVTIDVMDRFNCLVENNNYKSFTVKNQKYASIIYEVEADASSATYFESLAAITESEITINLPRHSIQGDAKFVDILEKIGATISHEGNTMTIKGNKDLKPIGEIDLNSMPDAAMTLAVIAPLLPGTTRITNVGNMRVKETDRIKAIVTELIKLGVNAKELEDGLEIEHCDKFNTGVQIETYDDHRMAMCFAILGAKIGGIEILDPNCCSKTYPGFFNDLEKLYAD